jgi:hypothetical protein
VAQPQEDDRLPQLRGHRQVPAEHDYLRAGIAHQLGELVGLAPGQLDGPARPGAHRASC